MHLKLEKIMETVKLRKKPKVQGEIKLTRDQTLDNILGVVRAKYGFADNNYGGEPLSILGMYGFLQNQESLGIHPDALMNNFTFLIARDMHKNVCKAGLAQFVELYKHNEEFRKEYHEIIEFLQPDKKRA